jgi:hypothetical protein
VSNSVLDGTAEGHNIPSETGRRTMGPWQKCLDGDEWAEWYNVSDGNGWAHAHAVYGATGKSMH